MFSNDDPATRREIFVKYLKTSDRVLWIDYGISIDDDSLAQVVSTDWAWHGVVFPCVTEGIDWDMFKKNNGSSEPLTQRGLHFDTDVDKRVRGDFFTVTKTQPKCFCVDTKHFLKNIKKEKISYNHEETFKELSASKFKTVAYTNARLIVTYPHECMGNILGAAGVSANT